MFTEYLFRYRWLPTMVLVLLVTIAYANSLTGPFLWDDLEIVVHNPLLHSWQNLSHIFRSSVFGGGAGGTEFYRPLVTLSFLVQYQLHGLTPLYYHAGNIMLHMGSTVLVYAILQRLQLTKAQALLVSALFAVHPIGIEVVTYISGRSDALVSVCILASLYAFLRIQEHLTWHLLCVLFLFAALLSKESAVVLPVIFCCIAWAFPNYRTKKHYSTAIALLCVCATYALYRLLYLESEGTGALSWIAYASTTDRLRTLPYILLEYLRIALWPRSLHMEYHTVITSWLHPTLWAGIPLLLGITWLCIWRTSPTEKRIRIFWLTWILLGLLPVLHIVAPQTSTVREHWIYLPAIGLFALLVRAKIWQKANADNMYIAALSVITACCISTIDRNRDWLEPMRLYAHDVQLEPQSFTLWNNVGTEYLAAGNTVAAAQAFTNAIQRSPNQRYSIAHNNLGVLYQRQGNYKEALRLYIRSIELSEYALAYQNAITLYEQLGQIEEANALRRQQQR